MQWGGGGGSHGGIYRTAAVYRHGAVIGGTVALWFIGSPAGLGGRANGAVQQTPAWRPAYILQHQDAFLCDTFVLCLNQVLPGIPLKEI